MDKQYSVEFFTSFLNCLQEVCQKHLDYSQFVEVSGYVSVEIDNTKKERYVLSELLQSSGKTVSDSYCTKTMKTIPQDVSWQVLQVNRGEMDTKKNKENFPKKIQIKSYVHGADHIPFKNLTAEVQTKLSNPRDKQLFHVQSKQSAGIKSEYSAERHSMQAPGVSIIKSKSFVATPLVKLTSSHGSGSSLPKLVDCRAREAMSRSCTSSETSIKSEPRSVEDEDETEDETEDEDSIDLDVFEDGIEDLQQAGNSSETHRHGTVDHFRKDMPGTSFAQPCSKTFGHVTSKVMKSAIKHFQDYHYRKHRRDINMLSTPPEELDRLLLDFFKGAKKQTGQPLSLTALKTIQKSLSRYLTSGGYPHSITQDRRFRCSRNYISSRLQEPGRSKRKCVKLTDEDVELLYQKKLLGGDNPVSLLNTMWFITSKYFSITTPADHFSLKWGDVRLNSDETGHEYLERSLNSLDSLKVFANSDSSRCLVNFYKMYRSRRPKVMMNDTSPFYLKAFEDSSYELWFYPESASWNFLTNNWREMAACAGLSKYITI